MKRLTFIIIVLLLASTRPAAGTGVDTINFIIDSVIINAAERSVGYIGLDDAHQADRPPLPIIVRHYFTKGQIPEEALKWRVLSADTLTLPFDPKLSPKDQITAAEAREIDEPIFFTGEDTLFPDNPVIIDCARYSGATVWSVTFTPIQYCTGRKIILNRVIEIYQGDRSDPSILSGLPAEDEDVPSVEPEIGQSLQKVGGYYDGCPLGSNLLVVTSPELADSFYDFLILKRRTGFDAALALTDSIYSRYGGRDQAESLREYLKTFYQFGGRYVILGGDESILPTRYLHYYNTSTLPDLYHSIPSDLYFADVDGLWDADGDGIWGEPTDDRPDIGADLTIGRLPFSHSEQVKAYTAKLEGYLFDPGHGNPEYLSRSLFFTSDQMRDYFEGGQQYKVAEVYPTSIVPDCERAAESPTGIDPAPIGPSSEDAMAALADGYGMVNVLAHGRPDGFVVNSSEYNQAPKTYLLTAGTDGAPGSFDNLPHDGRFFFYYGIACDQGAWDVEELYGMTVPTIVEELLGLDSAGAVGMVAFTRWGWIGSSYKLMVSFYVHLFGDAAGNPAKAMNLAKLDYPYYRDQIYGQNYFGDPSLTLYRKLSSRIAIDLPATYEPGHALDLRVSRDGMPQSGIKVTLMFDSIIVVLSTDDNGHTVCDLPYGLTVPIRVTAYQPGEIAAQGMVTMGLAADADDDNGILPLELSLSQNCPNPFNPTTTIHLQIPRAGRVTLRVFDILGREIISLVDGALPAGAHQFIWDGTDASGQNAASGIYFYALTTDEGKETRKMLLIR